MPKRLSPGAPGSPQAPAFAPMPGAPGLYRLATTGACGVYFLAPAGASPEASLGLQDSWDDVSGWYLFTEIPIPDGPAAAGFAKAAQADLPRPPAGPAWHAVVWAPTAQIADPTPAGLAGLTALLTTYDNVFDHWNVAKTVAFAFPPLSATLLAPAFVGAFVQDELGAWNLQVTAFQKGSQTAYFSLSYAAGSQAQMGILPEPWLISLPLTGPGAGGLHFPAPLDLGGLIQNLGCEFRYFYGPAGAQALSYPLLPPTPVGQTCCAFDVWLNPLFPLDPALSRFSFDLADRFSPTYSQNSRDVVSEVFFLTDGRPAKVRAYDLGAEASPVDPGGAGSGGFAFSTTGTASAGPAPLYLTPSGLFTLVPDSPPAASFELMAGLFEREFLSLQDGDMLAFVANQPALAAGFASASPGGEPGQAPGLTDACTTAWLQVEPGPAAGQRAYFSQPSASPYFGEVGETFPGAVDARLAILDAAPPAIPVAPYGEITGGRDLDLYAQFESQVLAGARHAILADPAEGPVITPGDRAAFDGPAAGASPPRPATAVTPQGMVVSLSEEGLWTAVTLARQPPTTDTAVSPDLALSFEALATTGVAPPALTALLTRDQLFLVVSQLPSDWPFQNRIFLGGFWFVLDVATDVSPSDGQTMLVFKYNTNLSLRALATEHSLWAGVDDFNPDPPAASAALLKALDVAQREANAPGGPFDDFNKIADDPGWTGLLAFNARIDGSGMPADLQMLLGGINGELRAHHFGLQSNHLERIEDVSTITQSSLFGVIYYDGLAAASPATPAPVGSPPAGGPAGPALDYEVETLTVVFQNSAIALFDVEIGMTINTLFGRAVQMRGPPASPGVPANTLRIKGQYQDRGGVGTVTFLADEASQYGFPITPETGPRVLDKVVVTQASLAPTSSVAGASPDTTAVSATFAMSGELWFNADPFPGSGGLDLFSYGNGAGPGAAGLGFTGLSILMRFTLGADGAMEPGSRTLELHPELMKPAPESSAIRPGSLLFSLPMQFSAFQANPAGLTATATGATPIHVLELESGGATTAAGSPIGSPVSDPLAGAPGPYATTSPTFALEYDISLGSLGSLSSVHGGISAKLLLGWGPSPTAPDADAAAVMIQLPQLSAGYSGFNLQGLLKTTFGDATLLKVDLSATDTVYAILLNNIQLSVFGYAFPPGVMVDFLLFSGTSGAVAGAPGYTGNLAWYLSVAEAA